MERFINSGNGVVIDTKTGHEWARKIIITDQKTSTNNQPITNQNLSVLDPNAQLQESAP